MQAINYCVPFTHTIDGEVMATFEESELIINENIGQRPIICIDLISQSIQRDIVLKFSTVNGTATGE